MMKILPVEMKQRLKIPPILVEKYKDDILFVVESNIACMEAVEPRVNFIDPMGYEMSEELIKGYERIFLEFEKDKECPR